MTKKIPKPKVIGWFGAFLMPLGSVLVIFVAGTSGWEIIARTFGIACLMIGSFFCWAE